MFIAVKKVLGIEENSHAFIFQELDRIGNHLQVFCQSGFQHLSDLQIRGFPYEAGIFKTGLQYDEQIRIIFCKDISPAGTAEHNEFRIFQR